MSKNLKSNKISNKIFNTGTLRPISGKTMDTSIR